MCRHDMRGESPLFDRMLCRIADHWLWLALRLNTLRWRLHDLRGGE